MKREIHLDNLRTLFVLLLFPFHASLSFSAFEFGGAYVYIHKNLFLHIGMTFLFPWYMTTLFVLAGMTCRYSLTKRTVRAFLHERTHKLLLPFLIGFLPLVPVQSYVADVVNCGYTGGFFEHFGIFFSRFTNFSGYDGGFTISHLWFILYLFVFTLLLTGIIVLQQKYAPSFQPDRLAYPWLLLLALPAFPAQFIGNVLSKSIGYHFFLLAAGYYVFSSDHAQAELHRGRFISLALMLVFGIPYTWLWCARFKEGFPESLLYTLFSWCGILTVLGFSKSLLSFGEPPASGETPSLSFKLMTYLRKAAFPVYLIHMPIEVLAAWALYGSGLPDIPMFLTVTLLSAALTFLLYELYRRCRLHR